jgi:hypothetical protein
MLIIAEISGMEDTQISILVGADQFGVSYLLVVFLSYLDLLLRRCRILPSIRNFRFALDGSDLGTP